MRRAARTVNWVVPYRYGTFKPELAGMMEDERPVLLVETRRRTQPHPLLVRNAVSRFSRARRSGLDPCADELSQLFLRARSRIASFARVPPPRDKIVLGQMLVQEFKATATVTLGILELLTNLADRSSYHAISMGAMSHRGCPGMLLYEARSIRV
jgi:hypothetical protein